MYLEAAQLESGLLRRLEGGAAGGLVQLLRSILRAHSSECGLEWGSTDGQEDGAEHAAQVDVSDAEVAGPLDAWWAWAADGEDALSQPTYSATAHLLAQVVVVTVLKGSQPQVPAAAVQAAWSEDAAGGSAVAAGAFKSSLVNLAAACSCDASAAGAGAVLSDLLDKLRGRDEERRSLMQSVYGQGGGAAAAAVHGDDDDSLFASDDESEAADARPAKDKDVPPAAARGAEAAPDAPAAEASVAVEGDDAAEALSLDLSPAPSRQSSTASGSAPAAQPAPKPAARPAAKPAPAAKAAGFAGRSDPSSKSLAELERQLSNASSTDLGDLPDASELERTAQPRQPAASPRASPARQPLLKGLMSSEEGKGNLADMPVDLRQWAQFKDANASPGRGPVNARQAPLVSIAAASTMFAGKHVLDARGGKPPPMMASRSVDSGVGGGNPLHAAIVGGSAVRQSMERRAHDSPASHRHHISSSVGGLPSRSRNASRASGVSRKPSVSEPGPDWHVRELPQLGHGARLHAHDPRHNPPGPGQRPGANALNQVLGQAGLRHGGSNNSNGSGGAMAAVEERLPALPSLAGARGPPKAMEMMANGRKSSHGPRADQHNASDREPGTRLPGLGPGGRTTFTHAAPPQRAGIRLPSKKSFRGGDLDF